MSGFSAVAQPGLTYPSGCAFLFGHGTRLPWTIQGPCGALTRRVLRCNGKNLRFQRVARYGVHAL
jgi:hypothetical protein